MGTPTRSARSIVFWASLALAAVGIVLRVGAASAAVVRGVGGAVTGAIRLGIALPRAASVHPALAIAVVGVALTTAAMFARGFSPLP